MKDRIKEEIGLYKLFLTFDFAVLTSVVSWFSSNLNGVSFAAKIILVFAVIIFLIAGLLLFSIINKKITQLDNL